MMRRGRFCLIFAFAAMAAVFIPGARAQEAPQTPPAPEGFPQFVFPGQEAAAETLSQYLWYHFHHRGGNDLVLFNKEYLLLSDMWLGGAKPRGTETAIQEVHRAELLGIEIDAEGYVNTHQHFSHAHDRGWPFPLWTQGGFGADGKPLTAVGWHFQELADVPGWVGDGLRHAQRAEYCGARAVEAWQLQDMRSDGIVDKAWRLETNGPAATMTSPEGYTFDAFNAPFLQIRWGRAGEPATHATPYVEWMCEGDTDFGPDRRSYFYPDKTYLSGAGWYHSILPMYQHPRWQGRITRLRIAFAPGETGVALDLDSVFAAYDTRHTINNPIFVLASRYYFAWTGDLDFLRRNIDRMRTALRYQQTVMGGLAFNRIHNTWPGHDGLPGWERDAAGNLTVHFGHGIGNNYWDIMPFGWDDFYATYQYYAATCAMADIESAILQHPGWNIPRGVLALDPDELRSRADAVKAAANEFFWNAETGRFVASIDQAGNRHDYGFTFLNLDAIWYGIASEEHARSIMDWISGRRVVEGDTSTGADIYHWRFGPRATTRRNLDWYGQGWTDPGSIPWGGQVQDGGAVLGFTFYDLWARLKIYGPDDVWARLAEIIAWEQEVKATGGYRAYYADGSHGTTLQGGGTAGGLGIDCEFYESSLLPNIVLYGFLGVTPELDGLHISPALPQAAPDMAARNVRYRDMLLDLRAGNGFIEIEVKGTPAEPPALVFAGPWRREDTGEAAARHVLAQSGHYRFTRTGQEDR